MTNNQLNDAYEAWAHRGVYPPWYSTAQMIAFRAGAKWVIDRLCATQCPRGGEPNSLVSHFEELARLRDDLRNESPEQTPPKGT